MVPSLVLLVRAAQAVILTSPPALPPHTPPPPRVALTARERVNKTQLRLSPDVLTQPDTGSQIVQRKLEGRGVCFAARRQNPKRCWEADASPTGPEMQGARHKDPSAPCSGLSAGHHLRAGAAGSPGSGMKEQPQAPVPAPPHLPRPAAQAPRPACCRRLPTASLETSFDGALMPSFSRG